jgi:hypothetical protein
MEKVNFVQTGNDNLKPIYKPRNLNDLPALYFDGSNNFLVTEKSYTSSIFSNSEVTIFMVIKYVGANNITAVFLKHELTSYRIGLEINNGKVRFDFPNPSRNATMNSSAVNKNIIITGISNKSNQKLYINSNLESNIANSDNINITSSASTIFTVVVSVNMPSLGR